MTATLRERVFYRAFGVDDVLRPLLLPGHACSTSARRTGRAARSSVDRRVDAVDIHGPSLDAARAAGVRGVCVQADMMQLPFANGSYDVVTALDVIEHLPKDRGSVLLAELERVCRGHLVVMTPYGFVEQPPGPGQPWMEHLSGWWPDDFRALGYEVRGTGGVRFARGAYSAFRWGPLGKAVGLATVPMARHLPATAYHIVAIKRAG